MTLFEARELTKVYQGRTVLSLKELLLEEEKIYALQGPNGSGKTTLLEILGLLIRPTAGKLSYQGKWIDFTDTALTALRREIVLVHQNPILFTTTVKKNVEFGLNVRGISGEERKKIVIEALDLVGMRNFLRARAHKLSGGETQRVAIARALACYPKVMLFDEPTSSVDVENRMIIERIIRNINAEKKISVVFTSHDLTQASRLSHDIIPLFEGRRVASLHENIFSATASLNEKGKTTYLIREGLSLIGEETETAGEVKISIDPLKLSVDRIGNYKPDRNRLRGKLFQLTDEQSLVRAVVDVGILINVLLPKKTVKQHSLTIGDELALVVPKNAITVF
ncbi:MAG: ATP-binding cassette domain-containing protein [Deltaproteobacteria bacterium]|nr:ATP-binding cassette domain-containing protein [Deltaproteobacteria bacterium]